MTTPIDRDLTSSGEVAGQALLEIQGMTTSLVIGDELRPVVQDMDLVIGRGEVVGLVGESGSGKSITARSVIGLLPPGAQVSGSVRFNGRDILNLSQRDLRTLRSSEIGMIFQDPRSHIDPLWRIEDYLTEGLRVLRGTKRAEADDRARQLLRDLGIVDVERVMRAYPGELSGGMLQRVMIAGVLSAEPELIIADEATTALDSTIQSDILVILKGLQRSRNLSVLFITHDLGVASVICDRIMVMYAGRPMSVQPADHLFDDPVHPYAAALVAARPPMERRAGRLMAIAGRPISALEVDSGCPFFGRCGYAQPACEQLEPTLAPVSSESASACVRVEEIRGDLKKVAGGQS